MEMKELKEENAEINDEEQGLTGTNPNPSPNFKHINTEPESHIQMKSFIERCPIFICAEVKNRLNNDELVSFYTLKKEINILYDETNNAHEEVLKDLYKICFLDEHTILQEV